MQGFVSDMKQKIPINKIVSCSNIFRRIILLFFVLAQITGCSDDASESLSGKLQTPGEENEWGIIALPNITQQPIKLRVASVVNSRFKQLSAEQIDKILKRSQQLVKQHFKLDVVFSDVDELAIKDVFSRVNPRIIKQRRNEIVDIGFIDGQAREKMQEAVFKTLASYQGNQKNVVDFAQPYLLQPEIQQKNFIDLSYALVDTLIARLNYWKTQTAADGGPVLDSNDYHQWVWWDSLGYDELPYDIVITNQLVASAEYYGMDVHSSIRGGITAGTTTYNKHTQFNAYVYIMVYPMLNDSDLLAVLRQDSAYENAQIINYSAALLTHELGHLLLHLGHPFGNKHCIMSPTVMLNYRDWYDNLDAAQCELGSSRDMSPGAAKLEYNLRW